jgi:hypothetical protein
MVFGVLLGGSELADRWRTRRSERSRSDEIAGNLDRFQWAVLEELAEARHRFLYRDRRQGNAEVRAFIAARDAATKVDIPDELAVYHPRRPDHPGTRQTRPEVSHMHQNGPGTRVPGAVLHRQGRSGLQRRPDIAHDGSGRRYEVLQPDAERVAPGESMSDSIKACSSSMLKMLNFETPSLSSAQPVPVSLTCVDAW